MSDSSSFPEGQAIVVAAEGVLRSWQELRIYHGRIPVGARDSIRRMCHRVGLQATETGRAFQYSFKEDHIDFAVGPPDAEVVGRELLESLRPYITEDWKIFSNLR